MIRGSKDGKRPSRVGWQHRNRCYGSTGMCDDGASDRWSLMPDSLTNFQKVKRFHNKFGLPAPEAPEWPTPMALQRRNNLTAEEWNEYKQAVDERDLVAVADAITDMLFVLYGTAVEFGIDADLCFDEVYDSNMSKLGEDGKPIVRPSDGKILKGPNFRNPNLAAVLVKQQAAASST